MLDRGQHCIKEAIEQNIEHDLKITDICRDAEDDNIIACAVAAKADYLMTGDSDLLEIKSYKDFKIVTPRILKRCLRDFEVTSGSKES